MGPSSVFDSFRMLGNLACRFLRGSRAAIARWSDRSSMCRTTTPPLLVLKMVRIVDRRA